MEPSAVSNPGRLLAVEIALLLDGEKRLLPAAMLLCNELQTRFRAGRVSYGQVHGQSIKVMAISNLREFDRSSELVRRIALAMEESADQDEEVVYPLLPGGRFTISREHAKLAVEGRHDTLLSVPLRWQGKVFAVITVERSELPFREEEALALRLVADMCVRRLRDLDRASSFFVVVWLRAIRNQMGHLFGLEWLGLKLLLAAFFGSCIAVYFIPWQYKVEAPFTLRTESLIHITAPFDGFIAVVHARVGDAVKAGDLLLEMDTRELLLQRMEAEMRLKALESEVRMAQSSGRLAEASLARVRIQEENTRIEMADFRLHNARVLAPQDGVIVEGDLLERIGTSTVRGDPFFKITRVEDLHARLELDERVIHEVALEATGEFAFASSPEFRYRFVLSRIEPSALSKPSGNVFYLRAEILDPAEMWWRPGMSGVAKIDVGERRLAWVMTHRLVDYLRMKFWF
jgi:hypothetical protein